jgi:hypothetical protein
MPSLGKDNTMDDACLLHATQVSEHDGGNGNRDYMLLTCEYAESLEAFDNRKFKIARYFFPKYKAASLVASLLEIAQSSGKIWEAPPEK